MDNVLIHVGVGHDDDPPGRGSGRFGWGTGENPNQHQFTFLSEVERLSKRGFKQSEIAQMLLGEKATAIDLRAQITIEKNNLKKVRYARAVELMEKYNGNKSAVAREMGLKNESTVRSILDPIRASRLDRYTETAEKLKQRIAEKGMIDVGAGTEYAMGVPDSTKKVAIKMLQNEGYLKSWVTLDQGDSGNKTTMVVLAPPGTTHGDVQRNKYNVATFVDYTPDQGKTWWKPEFPSNLDSNRVMVRYAEEGGKDKDGVIELRRGVEDISLGGSQYAQVRIAVDGTNYLKGMAMYGDDMPKGVDVIFNTNKKKGTPLIDPNAYYDKELHDWVGKEVSKRLKIDEKTMEVDRDNPFGALIKSPKDRDGIISPGGQRYYIDAKGEKKLSPINKLQDEGDWDNWSRTLSSQFLSKQPIKLIKQQLELSTDMKRVELDEIKRLTNPIVKQKLLEEFASGCDSNASDLHAKGFKGQAFQVILPIPSIKETEVYAPNYDDGETVALIRYPHGGTFEIPILKVNNKQTEAKSVMQNAADAIGIHPAVAERLSGADFDGDTVTLIPMTSNKVSISSSDKLKGLENFDPKELYKLPDSAPKMSNEAKQRQMGEVTNLITDMTVGGATFSQIERAVKHSMVVIDAQKHHLDYNQSARDNDIAALKKEWQGYKTKTGEARSGASTILSRASSEVYVTKRNEVTDIKKMTPEEVKRYNAGMKVYRDTTKTKNTFDIITDSSIMTADELSRWNEGKKVFRKTGEVIPNQKVKQMDLVDDARELVRNPHNQKEMAYADFANALKAMANEARKEARSIKPIPVNQSAKKVYQKEIEDLKKKIARAEENSPKERKARSIANQMVSEKVNSNPGMDAEHRRRAQAVALTQARAMVGAKKDVVKLTDREWEAIQAGAISTNRLKKILNNMKDEDIKKWATPRNKDTFLSDAQIRLMKSMISSGRYTQKEIADALGVSTSTVSNASRNLV